MGWLPYRSATRSIRATWNRIWLRGWLGTALPIRPASPPGWSRLA